MSNNRGLSFKSLVEFFQKKQPVSTTGVLRHAAIWLTGTRNNLVYTRPENEISPDPVAIYCIHGTADSNASFRLVTERLFPKMPPDISSFHLPYFETPPAGEGIEHFAKQLLENIKKNGHKRIILMGHSRGGLVAAWLAEYLASEAGINVIMVFPICSPFGGSDFAVAPFTRFSASVPQMQKNSEFLQSLNEKIRNSSIPYHFFAAENDTLVACQDCCPPSLQEKLTTLGRHGHLSIMSSHRIVDIIANTINQALTPENPDNDIPLVEIESKPDNESSPTFSP